MLRRLNLVLAAVLAVSLALAAPATAAEPTLTIRRLDASAWPDVTANVLFTGPTPDLRTFVVRQDDKIVPAESVRIQPLAKTATPVGVVLAIDTSGSMDGAKLARAKEAARQFVETKDEDVRIGVVSFSDVPIVVSDLTADAGPALAAIDALEARGETALWDGVSSAADLLSRQPDLLPYIVLLSDGANSVGSGSLDAAIAAGRRAAAPVFAVGLRGGGGEFDEVGLQQLAAATSGTYQEAANPEQLGRLYAGIQGVLENQYEITWASPGADDPEIDVSISVAGVDADAAVTVNSVIKAPPAPQIVDDKLAAPLPEGASGIGLVAGLIALAAAALAVAIAVVARPGEKDLESIVAAYTGAAAGKEQEPEGVRSLGLAPREVSQSVGKLIDVVASRAGGTDVMERLDRRLDQADIKVQAQEAVLIGSLSVLVFFGVGALAGGPVLGLAGAIVGGLFPIAAVNFRAERRQRTFVNQLPDTLNLLASSLRAGFSLLQGLDAVSQEVEAPMGRELRRVVLETRLGRPIEDALDDTAQRMASADFEWVVMAIKIQREVGGNLAELLSTVADTMVAREQLRREVSALTAEGRLSAIVIGVMPPGLAVAISVLNPGYLSVLVETGLGKAMILGAAALAAVGFVWMRRTIQVDV